MLMLRIYFGGEIRHGRKGVEYSISPRFSLSVTGEYGWYDVKGEIYRQLGYSENEYNLKAHARVNVGTTARRYYEKIEIVCDQSWRGIYIQSMRAQTQYTFLDLYIELVPIIGEIQPQLFVNSMVPETNPEPRQTQYNDNYAGPSFFEPYQTQQTPRQDPRQTQYSGNYAGPSFFEPYPTQQTPRRDLYLHPYPNVNELSPSVQTEYNNQSSPWIDPPEVADPNTDFDDVPQSDDADSCADDADSCEDDADWDNEADSEGDVRDDTSTQSHQTPRVQAEHFPISDRGGSHPVASFNDTSAFQPADVNFFSRPKHVHDTLAILSGRPVGTKEDVTLSDTMPLSPDPAGFQDQVAVLFSEWCQLCDLPVVNDMTYSHYISQLQQNGLLKGDEITNRFFRVLTELSVAHSLVKEPAALGAVQNHTNEQISFFPIDSYAKLTVVILKYASVEQVPSKALLLMKLLLVTAKVIVKDAEEKKTDFNARPYFRLFVNWLLDIVSPDLDGANYEILTCFASAFLALQPLIVPSFSFAWLELLCHENFMPKILTCNYPEGWPHFQCLLVCLFKFVEPFLRKSQLPEPVVLLYKGILKMMVVLLLDFPEFLCDYHLSLCDVLPTTCVQLRNLILSAFPRNMTVPDPCTPKLKVDLLPEIQQAPRILSDVEGALKEKQMKSDIDEYLKTRPEGSSFLDELRQKLLLPQSEVSQAGMPYNVPLINSLVLYIGMQAIQQLQSNNTDIILVEAAMDIYQSLVKNLDTEGRYYLINAICNQLRYPNSHTLYFTSVLLSLWTKASSSYQELIQEQIARVLLERLIVRWPCPWGLIITFMEITKNSQYNFWNQPFIRVAPDIEELFKSVARSWGVRPTGKALEDAHPSAGVPDANN